MSNSEAPAAPEFTSADAGTHSSSAQAVGNAEQSSGADPTDYEAAAADPLAARQLLGGRGQRIGAWVEAGATSLPAMLIAIGSAAAGGVALAIRRRRRR